MRRPRGVKSIETKHYEERDAFFAASTISTAVPS
jgi:hypothetical protein